MAGSALYLYCVVPVSGTAPTCSAPALDGGAVQAVRRGDLAVLTHPCPAEPYQGGEEQVRRWIAAHNAVVEEAWAATGTVLPMSFDVIVASSGGRGAEANLIRWLARHEAALGERLRALAGRTEVGVQVLWDTTGAAEAGVPLIGETGPAPRGRAFFARQQARRQAREEFARRADRARERYLADLAALADDVRVNDPRPAQGKQVVINISLLVTKAAIARVGDYLEKVADDAGTQVRFTGPWPPYSFAGSFGNVDEGHGGVALTAPAGAAPHPVYGHVNDGGSHANS